MAGSRCRGSVVIRRPLSNGHLAGQLDGRSLLRAGPAAFASRNSRPASRRPGVEPGRIIDSDALDWLIVIVGEGTAIGTGSAVAGAPVTRLAPALAPWLLFQSDRKATVFLAVSGAYWKIEPCDTSG